jgi:hypothetical protein
MSYITFKSLGAAGDLCSQMQQYASLYAIAKKTGKKIIFPESSIQLGWGFKFKQVLNIQVEFAPDSFFKDFIDIAPRENLLVDNSMFILDEDTNYNITGLMHVYSYWHTDFRDDVEKWAWSHEYYTAAKLIIDQITPPGKELVAIHVRRGDYLLPQHHHFCQLDYDYYSEAIRPYLENLEKYHFVVFSNDIKWCKENLIEGDSVTFIEPGLDFVDLIAMSLCNHNVIANSSYSWWAAFMNKNEYKRITCPSNYVKDYSTVSFINKNFYPPTWINIDNK